MTMSFISSCLEVRVHIMKIKQSYS